VKTHSVRIVLTPVAQTVKDVLSRSFESLGHGVEALKGDERSAKATHVVAVVVFEIINAPVGKALGIILFMIQRTSYTRLEDASN
jgi:hypothetical protein